MILSYEQIENIATTVIQDYRTVTGIMIESTAIEQLATDYLGLTISFEDLSDDGSLCGLSAYSDTKLQLYVKGVSRTIHLKKNQIVLDSSFIKPGQVRTLSGKRRFTLAHEVAHQILFALDSNDEDTKYTKPYATRLLHTARELNTAQDWNEWQANVLGAALLMPKDSVSSFMSRIPRRTQLISYNGYFNCLDKQVIKHFCNNFAVSRSAASIRLKHLGYLNEYPINIYSDLSEVHYG